MMFFTCETAVRFPGFSLEATIQAKKGELITLLGPSGCGKTTLLRTIAGLEQLTSGYVELGGRDITRLPPEHRKIGFVFQDYALFPHLNVFENIAYGPKTQKWSRSRIMSAVSEMLELTGLTGYELRMPVSLSGGEQQRVALARALAVNPELLLLDEPLSALDAKIRNELKRRVSEIQRKLQITTIYVTHDQEEALAISDNLALMNKGRIVQYGPPRSLYLHPESEFAAGFIGSTNIIRLNKQNGGTLKTIFFRPEHCLLEKPDTSKTLMFSGEITYMEYLGKDYLAELRDEAIPGKITFYLPAITNYRPGGKMDIYVLEKDISILSDKPE